MLFPAHYTEVVQGDIMTCDVAVVIDRGGGFQVFLVSLSKCSSCLTYVLLITFQPITFVSINYWSVWSEKYISFVTVGKIRKEDGQL